MTQIAMAATHDEIFTVIAVRPDAGEQGYQQLRQQAAQYRRCHPDTRGGLQRNIPGYRIAYDRGAEQTDILAHEKQCTFFLPVFHINLIS